MRTGVIRVVKWLAILVAVAIVLHTVLLLLSGLAVERAYDDLRQAGRPMRADEIIPPAVPDGENAALLYESAFALLKSEPWGDDTLLDSVKAVTSAYLADPDSVAAREAFEKLLENKTLLTALELVERGAARPSCRFDVQYDQGATALLPHLGKGMMGIGSLLPAKAVLEASRGNGDQAWRTIETALRVADALRTEPILASQLVRIALCRNAFGAIRHVGDMDPPDEATALRVAAALAAMDSPEPFVLAIDGERLLMGEWAFDWAKRAQRREILSNIWEGDAGLDQRMLMWLLYYGARFQADRAAYLRVMQRIAEDVPKPVWETPVLGPADDEGPDAVPPYCILSKLLLPALSAARMRLALMQAEARVTRVGLALKRHKAVHGSYPGELAGIDPSLPAEQVTDPFTGQPLVYRMEGNGFVLYSFGENRQDDGGKPEPQGEARKALSSDEQAAKAWDVAWQSQIAGQGAD